MQIQCLGFGPTLLFCFTSEIGENCLFMCYLLFIFNYTNLALGDKLIRMNISVLTSNDQNNSNKTYSIIGNYFLNYTRIDQFIENYPNCYFITIFWLSEKIIFTVKFSFNRIIPPVFSPEIFHAGLSPGYFLRGQSCK